MAETTDSSGVTDSGVVFYSDYDLVGSAERCGCKDGFYRNSTGSCVTATGCKPANIRKK